MNNFRKNKKEKRDGYTMIEILVVISIIGFMLSVAMYLLTSARENARIARAKEFASSVNGKLGSNMIGWWSFDEGSGTDVKDGWAKNNGCLEYGINNWVSGMFGKAFYFNGGTALKMPCTGVLNAAISSNDVTITAWFKADAGNVGTIAALGPSRAFGLIQAGLDSGKIAAPNNGNVAKSAKPYNDGKWHFAAVKMGSGGTQIWVDGTLDGNSSTAVDLYNPLPSTLLKLGTGQGSAWAQFTGTIDDVKLYNESLTAREIQKLYAESAPKYALAVK